MGRNTGRRQPPTSQKQRSGQILPSQPSEGTNPCQYLDLRLPASGAVLETIHFWAPHLPVCGNLLQWPWADCGSCPSAITWHDDLSFVQARDQDVTSLCARGLVRLSTRVTGLHSQVLRSCFTPSAVKNVSGSTVATLVYMSHPP